MPGMSVNVLRSASRLSVPTDCRCARLAKGHRPVAPIGRAAVSKTAGWGFESLLACFSTAGIRREPRFPLVDGAATDRSGDLRWAGWAAASVLSDTGDGGAESPLVWSSSVEGFEPRVMLL